MYSSVMKKEALFDEPRLRVLIPDKRLFFFLAARTGSTSAFWRDWMAASLAATNGLTSSAERSLKGHAPVTRDAHERRGGLPARAAARERLLAHHLRRGATGQGHAPARHPPPLRPILTGHVSSLLPY